MLSTYSSISYEFYVVIVVAVVVERKVFVRHIYYLQNILSNVSVQDQHMYN